MTLQNLLQNKQRDIQSSKIAFPILFDIANHRKLQISNFLRNTQHYVRYIEHRSRSLFGKKNCSFFFWSHEIPKLGVASDTESNRLNLFSRTSEIVEKGVKYHITSSSFHFFNKANLEQCLNKLSCGDSLDRSCGGFQFNPDLSCDDCLDRSCGGFQFNPALLRRRTCCRSTNWPTKEFTACFFLQKCFFKQK